MQIDVGYQAIPIHAPFHKASNAFERHMFGAVGSGKTYGVCAEAIAWCLEQPGIRGVITRKTIPELRDTTETVFFDILPPELRAAGKIIRLGGHVADFTFPNGSKVLFRSIDDWQKHKSLNLGFIGWDEMDEFDLDTYIGMKTRLRQKEPTHEGKERGAGPITQRGTWGASNPAGHNWLWDYFIKQGNGRYFTSTSFDNPHLTPDYFDNLLSMPEQWIHRYVLCQFDDFAGQIYNEWTWESHVIPRYPRNPLNPAMVMYPEHSMFWMGMDPGTSQRSPTGGLWVVVERKPRLRFVGVAEYVQGDAAANVHAAAWRQIEAKNRLRVTRRIADPNSIGVRDRGSNNRLDDIYRRLGFRFEQGPSRWPDRIEPLQNLIHTGQFVVTEDCPMTFEAIRDAKWKELSPAQKSGGEDAPYKPAKKDRELCDAAEYIAGRWTSPMRERLAAPPGDWSWEIRNAIKKQVTAKSRARHQGSRVHAGVRRVW